MTGALSFSNLPIFCTAGNKVQPDATTLTIGWQPQQEPPCEFFNFMSFAETTNLSTLASGINNVIAELDTVVVSGGATPNSSLANQLLPSLNALYANNYDLVIDSNAKLDLWCQAVAGQYKRVLIRAGTWTASALGPTAGVLINLDSTGTTYVFGEKGSSLNYSGSYATGINGLYHSAVPTDMSVERFDNVKINITNSNNASYGFCNCTNLTNCTGTGASTGTDYGYGFAFCTNLINCTGNGTGGSGGGGGFSSCTNLTNCTGNGIGANPGYGFDNCTNLINCTGVGSGTGTGGGHGFSRCTTLTVCSGEGNGTNGYRGDGYYLCNSLTNCTGLGVGTGGGGYGFRTCIGLVLCMGRGLDSGAGAGYGFSGCTKMQQNKPSDTSKTATYNVSYADSGTGNACADTAAGGYNS